MYFNRKEQFITIEGKRHSPEEIRRIAVSVTTETPDYLRELYAFLDQWFDDSLVLTVHTSGSTGTPKELTVRKEQMMQSARMTCEALQLLEEDTALLCMSLQYIAGQMMVVRALVGGLNLLVRAPSSHPLVDVFEKVHFAAMVPLQVYHTLETPEELSRLQQIDTLIIGGGMINPSYSNQLRLLPGKVYATYGMTETLSHIALCLLNGASSDGITYQPLPGITLTTESDGALVIDAPLVCDEVQYTHDIVSLADDGCFRILGRKDNTINSGGIKMQPEVLEQCLQSSLSVPFVFTCVPHDRLGEAAVLLVEGAIDVDYIRTLIHKNVPHSTKCSKWIGSVDQIPLTGNGKIDRVACKQLAYSLFGNPIRDNQRIHS